MKRRNLFILFLPVFVLFSSIELFKSPAHKENGNDGSIKINILYDNYLFMEGTKSDWGFSCLIEGTEKTILFDTGAKPDIFLLNINFMKVDLCTIQKIIISHAHGDHTGGILSVFQKDHNATIYLTQSFPSNLHDKIKILYTNIISVDTPMKIC